MAEKNVTFEIRARNLTSDAFKKITEQLKDLEEHSESVTKRGGTNWSQWFAVIGGGVAVGNLLTSAFKTGLNVLAQVPGALLEIGRRGSDVADVRGAFESLAGGAARARDTLGELRSAFGGTLTDFDLMKSANEVLQRGVQLSSRDFSTLAKGARVLGESLGDPKARFDGMLSAIAKGNERELKQLGVNLGNIERHVDAYAASIGRNTSHRRRRTLRRAPGVERRVVRWDLPGRGVLGGHGSSRRRGRRFARGPHGRGGGPQGISRTLHRALGLPRGEPR